MKPEKSFDSIFEQSYQSSTFWEELAILSFTGSVVERLEALGMTKKNLAEELGVSPAYVTKLIGGNNNFTIRTMVKIARHLKCELNVSLRAAVAKAQFLKPGPSETLPCTQSMNRAAVDHEDLALAA